MSGVQTGSVQATRLEKLEPISHERLARVREWLSGSGIDALLLSGFENVQYSTGYRSSPGSHRRPQRLVVVLTEDRTTLIGPTAERPAALTPGTVVDEYIGYGTFYFVGDGDHGPDFGDLPSALAAVLPSDARSRRWGIDAVDWASSARSVVEACAEEVLDISVDLQRVRAVKVRGEIERLRRAAQLAEEGISAAIAEIAPGVTERELAAVVAQTMSHGGAVPRFLVVATGERTALSDVFASDAAIAPGDLVRFDVGCTFDGYSSDIGRMAILGAPDSWQREHYAAILAGERAQAAAARPGLTAGELFTIAVDNVEAAGIRPYRRNHCGHGIGMDTYEAFSVAPGADHVLEPGNVLCIETPYYELGRGGMLVEDALLITEDGCESLTVSSRELAEVPA